MSRLVVSLLCGVLFSCASGHVMPLPVVKTLSLDESNPLLAISESQGLTVIATPTTITLYRYGKLAATSLPPSSSTWIAMTDIDALDSDGRWIVAADSRGDVWRILESGDRVRMTESLGVARVKALAGAGTTLAVSVPGEIAVTADGHVFHYPGDGMLAAGRGRVAVATTTHVYLWDLRRATSTAFDVDHATYVGFANDSLLVATRNFLFIGRDGALAPIPVPNLRAVAVGEKIVVLADHVYVVDGDHLRKVQIDAADARGAFAVGNSIWLVRPERVERYAFVSQTEDRGWYTDVEPMFRRFCAACHLPDGTAGVDLSSPDAWRRHAASIHQRVIVERSMPPTALKLTEDDQRLITRWLRP